MILDLQRFIANERPYWDELERLLNGLERRDSRPSLPEVRRLHYLYERTAGGLVKVHTFASEPATSRYLESLVARAYGQMHETPSHRGQFSSVRWFFQTLPQTFRRQARAFWLSVIITVAGALFGGFAVA